MPNKSSLVKIVRNAIAMTIILGFVYFGIMPFIFGGKNMESFCSQVTPGMHLNEVYKLIEQTDYKFIENSEGDIQTITIIDSKAMGRFICEVDLDQDKVMGASYVAND
jgi:hypothetical protein